MSYNIHTEMPSGAISKGYDAETEEDALKIFQRLEDQLVGFKFVGSIVVEEGGIELQREDISGSN